MSIVQTDLLTLQNKFPDHKETINSQYAQSETFKTICEDYYKCVTALQHYKKFESQDALQRRREYEELIQELEKEILQYLNKNQNSDEKGTE